MKVFISTIISAVIVIIIIAFALLAPLGKSQKKVAQIALPTKVIVTGTTVTGVLRTSGLSEQEKRVFGLTSSVYQLTDFGKNTRLLPGHEVQGLYIESDKDYALQLGKCVEVEGKVHDNWKKIGKDSTLNGQYSYNRIAFITYSIKETNLSHCSPYPEIPTPTLSSEKIATFSGVLERFTRPAPDVGYDYLLRLKFPFEDPEDASGLLKKKYSVIIMPIHNSEWQRLESAIGKNIAVDGFMMWGLAESRYLQIQSIK